MKRAYLAIGIFASAMALFATYIAIFVAESWVFVVLNGVCVGINVANAAHSFYKFRQPERTVEVNGHREGSGNYPSGASIGPGSASLNSLGPFDTGEGKDEGTDPCLNVPDSAEAIVGWRHWSLNGRVLKSYNDTFWNPGEPMRAICQAFGRMYGGMITSTTANSYHIGVHGGSHSAPDEACSCGIYALKEYDTVAYGNVFGTINLWGKVVVQEKGYRAEYGYPKEVWVPLPQSLHILTWEELQELDPCDESFQLDYERYRAKAFSDRMDEVLPTLQAIKELQRYYGIPVHAYDPSGPFTPKSQLEASA